MRVSSHLLDDTLKLVQLARETARLNGQPSQVEQLTPLVDNLTTLATKSQSVTQALPPDKTRSVAAQDDFKALLSAVQAGPEPVNASIKAEQASNQADRNYIITAMSNGGMSALDIARQMGMTTDEVQMVLTLNRFKPGNV
jgi:chemotaxis response regulator CheB